MSTIINDSNAISINYRPSLTGNAFPRIGCVEAGDRFIWNRTTFGPQNRDFVPNTSDIIPDEQGYLPHIVYRPKFPRLMDPMSWEPNDANQRGVFGNDTSSPEIRMDIGSIFCPWPGSISIEGGAPKPDADPAACALVITWLWDRPWGASISQVLASILRQRDSNPEPKAGGVNNGQRQPKSIHLLQWQEQALWAMQTVKSALTSAPRRAVVDNRGLTDQYLTFYNVPGPHGESLIPTRVERPRGAETVWTPDSQLLYADFGRGTTAAPLNSRFGQPVRLGPFTHVWAPVPLGVLQFGIRY